MSGALWRGHPATPCQQRLKFLRGPKQTGRRVKATQANVLLDMLRQARAAGQPVQLPEIMAAGIAQHGARFNELRSRGFVIHNETERSGDGRVFSRYWLRHDPERDPAIPEGER